MKIGIIGYGAIGKFLEKELADIGTVSSLYVFDLLSVKTKHSTFVENIETLIEIKPDLIIECASVNAVKEYGEIILSSGIDILILSTGALISDNLIEHLKSCAISSGSKIYIPNGAISGVDGVSSAANRNINCLELITTKNPLSLGRNDTEKTVIFSGSAYEAIKKFPKNINVSAILSLASGLSGNQLNVKIISDPSSTTNRHEIFLESDSGNYHFISDNFPMPDNPGTSYSAALSALALVKKILSPIKIG